MLSQELRSPDSLLLETAAQMGAQRIFIDGISLLRTVSNHVNHANGDDGNGMGSYRQLLQLLLEGLQRENLTAILSHEVTAVEQQAFALEVTEFLCDTVIVLRREPKRRGTRRSLEITKSRGQDYDTGLHTLRITAGQGLEVFRRVQAPPRDPGGERQPTSTHPAVGHRLRPARRAVRRRRLRRLRHDGGGRLGRRQDRPGHAAAPGRGRNQKRGLMVSLDEHPEQVMRNAETLGLNLREHLESGTIQFFYDSPRELELDVHFARITRIIEQHNIERLIIDGMTSYQTALEDEQLYREFFHALVDYSKQRLMTTFLSYENPELFGVNQFMPEFPVSSIVDNIVLLNFVELSNTLHRAITVAKARGSANQFVTREFTIGPGGISLVPVDEAQALPVLPFSSYYGLLSRAPTRLSPSVLPDGGNATATGMP